MSIVFWSPIIFHHWPHWEHDAQWLLLSLSSPSLSLLVTSFARPVKRRSLENATKSLIRLRLFSTALLSVIGWWFDTGYMCYIIEEPLYSYFPEALLMNAFNECRIHSRNLNTYSFRTSSGSSACPLDTSEASLDKTVSPRFLAGGKQHKQLCNTIYNTIDRDAIP